MDKSTDCSSSGPSTNISQLFVTPVLFRPPQVRGMRVEHDHICSQNAPLRKAKRVWFCVVLRSFHSVVVVAQRLANSSGNHACGFLCLLRFSKFRSIWSFGFVFEHGLKCQNSLLESNDEK